MIDIAERLRSHMGKADIGDVLPDCRAGADEIERLRKALGYALSELDYIVTKHGYASTATAAVRVRDALDLVGTANPSPTQHRANDASG